MTRQKSDVLIIGGGIMGSSSAFLQRRHGRTVTLQERAQIGQ
ncbi:FAD-dependent oxidoreductase, partial [Pseudomonas syringae group genomosp. 7]